MLEANTLHGYKVVYLRLVLCAYAFGTLIESSNVAALDLTVQ